MKTRNFIFLCIALQSSSIFAERFASKEDPQIMFEAKAKVVYRFYDLPLNGKYTKDIWYAKNWKDKDRGFAKRRDGTFASEIHCPFEVLSPSEKLDLCIKKRGNSVSYAKKELDRTDYKDRTDWAGVCDTVKSLQMMGDKPESRMVDHIFFTNEEVFALQCLYLIDQGCSAAGIGESDEAARGHLVNAGSFHIALANALGIQGGSFIQIPEFFDEKNPSLEREIYSELVLGFASIILEQTSNEVLINTEISTLIEDRNGNDNIVNRALTYKLELEDGNIVGGSWVSGYGGPLFMWLPHPKDLNYFEKIKDGSYIESLLGPSSPYILMCDDLL